MGHNVYSETAMSLFYEYIEKLSSLGMKRGINFDKDEQIDLVRN